MSKSSRTASCWPSTLSSSSRQAWRPCRSILADVIVAVECRDAQHNQEDEQHLVVLRDELADARPTSGQQRACAWSSCSALVRGCRITQGSRMTAAHARRAQRPLLMTMPRSQAQREAHEAQGDEARDGGQASCRRRRKGVADGARHGLVLGRLNRSAALRCSCATGRWSSPCVTPSCSTAARALVM